MADGHGQGGPSAPQDAAREQEQVQEQPTLPLPAARPADWRQRIAALLPTQRLPAVAPASAPPSPGSPTVELKQRRVWLARWGLIVLAVLVLVGAGSGLYKLSHAPEDAASQLCADVQAGHFAAAYDLLGASLRAQVSRADFVRIGSALDRVDGRVTDCTATSYAYALGSSNATIDAHIVRADGQTFNGRLAMANENGWKVSTLDPRLTGASLGALDVALRFCDALRANDAGAVLGLSGTSAIASTGLGDAQQLATTLTTWQQVDGAVTGCALAGTGPAAGASDTAAQVTLSVTRARRGTAVAALGLAKGAPGWRVTAIGPNLLGSDLGPLAVGQHFCAALASGNYADAYALFSPTYAAQVTLDQFTAAFAPLGGAWSCAPQLNTYAVSGASGSYDVALTLNGATPAPLALTATLRFALAGDTWAIQDVEPHGQ